MNSLERHIEILLLSNDCVMVPGLGGFMTHHVCAKYNDKDYLLIPPLRTLGFNPKLKANDNLLAQSYVEAFDISFPEAMQRIEDEVGELHERLLNDGIYTFNGIGTLSVNNEGNIEFMPIKAGLLTPELYAFDTLPIKMLTDLPNTKTLKAEETNKETAKANVIELKPDDNVPVFDKDSKDDAIKIKVSVIRNVAAVIIALLGFFLFTSPLATGNLEMGMMNINTDMLYQIMPKVIVSEGSKTTKPIIKKEKTEHSPKAIELKNKETKQDLKVAETKNVYCIVMASQISQTNGETFLNTVHKEGFTSAKMIANKNSRKIVYGEFTSEAKAHEELKKLHTNKFFKQAWVYEIKQ